MIADCRVFMDCFCLQHDSKSLGCSIRPETLPRNTLPCQVLSGFERCTTSLPKQCRRALPAESLRHRYLSGQDEANQALFIMSSNHTFKKTTRRAEQRRNMLPARLAMRRHCRQRGGQRPQGDRHSNSARNLITMNPSRSACPPRIHAVWTVPKISHAFPPTFAGRREYTSQHPLGCVPLRCTRFLSPSNGNHAPAFRRRRQGTFVGCSRELPDNR